MDLQWLKSHLLEEHIQSASKPQTPLSWWAEVAAMDFYRTISLLVALPRHGFLPSGPQRAFLFLSQRINKVLSVSSQEREEPCSVLKMHLLSVSQREPCCFLLANTKMAERKQINCFENIKILWHLRVDIFSLNLFMVRYLSFIKSGVRNFPP